MASGDRDDAESNEVELTLGARLGLPTLLGLLAVLSVVSLENQNVLFQLKRRRVAVAQKNAQMGSHKN